MTRLNWSGVVLGGLLWALTYSVAGGLAMVLFLAREFLQELERMGGPLELNADSLLSLGIFGVLFTVISGVVAVWLYVAAPVSHLGVFGITSARFVAIDLPTELVGTVIATLAGARIYRE